MGVGGGGGGVGGKLEVQVHWSNSVGSVSAWCYGLRVARNPTPPPNRACTRPSTLNPKPKTLNPKPQTANPKPISPKPLGGKGWGTHFGLVFQDDGSVKLGFSGTVLEVHALPCSLGLRVLGSGFRV